MERLRSWLKRAREEAEEENSEPAPLPLDRRIDGLQLEEVLGDGGTATVYGARDAAGRELAVKIPHRGVLSDREFVRNFRREAELGVTLRHPSIVRVLAVGSYGALDLPEIPYFVMERLHGRDLGALLKEEGRLPQDLAVLIARAIADALDWAHQRGVVHRDISPGNVFLTAQKAVKVMDFGISAVCSEGKGPTRGLGRGTPAYLAPERATDFRSTDPRADLYALGCVLYEMLAGRPPFPGGEPEEVLRQHLQGPVPPLPEDVAVRPDLQRLVLRLLEKDPARRYQTAREVLVALAELL